MKRVGTVCSSSRVGVGGVYGCGVTRTADDRVGKHRLENCEEEMQACFARLMQLVPTVPPNGRMTRVQLLQHVIDYILDLENTLDFRPSESVTSGKTDDAEDSCVASSNVPQVPAPSQYATDRRPLTEKAQVYNVSQSPPETSQQSPPISSRQPTTWS